MKKQNEGEYPFSLKVRTRDGKEYGVSYKDKETRNRMALEIAEKVERVTRKKERVLESIYNKLYLMEEQTRRTEKRTLSIWKQLKAILGVKVEEK